MRVDPNKLRFILSSDKTKAQRQIDACQAQIAAVHGVVMSDAQAKGAAYDSARDYLGRVKLPALQCQLVFLDALVGDLDKDMAALEAFRGETLDSDELETAIAAYGRLIDGLDERQRSQDNWGTSSERVMRLSQIYEGARARLDEKLQILSRYASDGSIYANSQGEAACLQGATDALGQVGYDASTRTYDLSRVENGAWNSDDMRRRYWQACLALFLNSRDAPPSIRAFLLKELMGTNESTLFGGDPVNLSTGNFIHRRDFLHMGGLFPLSFSLFYNSQAEGDAALGTGWTQGMGMRIEAQYPGMVSLRSADGHETLFFLEDGGYVGASAEGALAAREEGGWRYTDRRANSYLFDGRGVLTRVEDADGCALALSYGDDGLLATAESSSGEGLAFHHEGGLLVRVDDTAGRSVLLEHERGLLVALTDELGHTRRYGYDEAGRIVSLTNELGATTLRNEYDDQGRVVRQAFANGAEIRYRFDESGHHLVVTDQEGRDTAYESDGLYRTIAHEREDGTERFAYDLRNLRTSHTSRRGHETRFDYDDGGWLRAVVNAEGQRLAFKRDAAGRPLEIKLDGRPFVRNSFDGHGRLVEREDALGRKVGLSYDATGRLAELVQPDGSTVRFTRDAHGNVARIEADSGVSMCYDHDELGRVVAQTDGAGGVTRYEYDARGNVVCVTNALGDRRRYRYDACGNMVELIDYDGLSLKRSYDALGLLREAVDKAGGVCTFEYDGFWRLAKVTDQLGASTSYAYDRQGRLESVTNALGESVRYAYDADDRCTQVTYPSGARAHFDYDKLGRMVQARDCAGYVTRFSHNRFGQVTGVVDPAGNMRSAEYDEAGQLVAMTDELGARISLEYDALGHVTAVTDPRGVKRSYEYLPGGLIGRSIAPGGAAVSYAYDACGRLRSIAQDGGETLSFERDPLGRIIRATGASGWSRQYEYDALGRCSSMRDALGNRTRFSRNALGELAQTVDALGGVTSYAYDARGSLVGCTRAGSGGAPRRTCFERDALGRITKAIDPLGNSLSYAYNAAGQLSEVIDEEGCCIAYGYSPAGRLENVRYEDGREVRFGYDALGRVRDIADWLGTTSLTRDAVGRVTKAADTEGNTVFYDYAADGRLAGMTYPNGMRLSYAYDRFGRLSRLTAQEASVSYEYDDLGRLVRKTASDGLDTRLDYDAFGRVTRASSAGPQGDLIDTAFSFDAGGRTIERVVRRTDLPDAGGAFSYAYDAVGRLTSVTRDGALSCTYEYDAFGNRVREQRGEDTVRSAYDDADRLVRRDSPLHTETFSYDRRGNLLSVTADGTPVQTFEFDSANRLAAARDAKSGRQVRYLYNGVGKRVVRVETDRAGEESTTRYVRDLSRGGRNLLQESGPSTGDRAFVWDGAPLAACDDDGMTWLVTDELGSPLIAVGRDGMPTGSAAYDAFGTVDAGEDGLLGLAFSAYGADPLTHTLFAEAREYSPRLGRFMSRDSRIGLMGFPQTLNRYAYCWNAPVDHVDASGHWPYAGVLSGPIRFFDYVTDAVASPGPGGAAEGVAETVFEGAAFVWGLLPAETQDKLGSIGFSLLKGLRLALEGRIPIDIEFGPISIRTEIDLLPYDISDLWHDWTINTPAGNAFLEAASFYRDDQGIYHTEQRCWQAPFGYNDFYDDVFKGFTSARPNKFDFIVGDTEYTLWLWKGDYYNLGVGAESGIYRGDGFHRQSATDTNLHMKLNLYDARGNVAFIYDPGEPNWWTTGFNPDIQDANQEDYIAFGSVDFSAEPALWDAFYAEHHSQVGWCFDEERKVAYYAW